VITVVAVSGLVTVQDGGRPGHMHEGVPPGGPLVPELLARANAAVGNEEHEAGLELFGALTLAGNAGTQVASDDGVPVELGSREAWSVGVAGARVRYVAVRGGIDVARVLGGRGTLLGAGLGGHEGRALRRGDVLPVGERGTARRRPPPAAPELDAAIEFRVDPRSDRVGVRLTGPGLRRVGDDLGASSPMLRGAIQVPLSGEPIVLGPDHPTTGGYPVLAVVVVASQGALGARPVGGCVRFVATR
jgi:allophanate hydrolase subunit 2